MLVDFIGASASEDRAAPCMTFAVDGGEVDPPEVVAPWRSLVAACGRCDRGVHAGRWGFTWRRWMTMSNPRLFRRYEGSIACERPPATHSPAIASPDDPDSDEASAPFNVLLLADQQTGFGAYPLSLTADAVDIRVQAEAPSGEVNSRYRLSVEDDAGKRCVLAEDTATS